MYGALVLRQASTSGSIALQCGQAYQKNSMTSTWPGATEVGWAGTSRHARQGLDDGRQATEEPGDWRVRESSRERREAGHGHGFVAVTGRGGARRPARAPGRLASPLAGGLVKHENRD